MRALLFLGMLGFGTSALAQISEPAKIHFDRQILETEETVSGSVAVPTPTPTPVPTPRPTPTPAKVVPLTKLDVSLEVDVESGTPTPAPVEKSKGTPVVAAQPASVWEAPVSLNLSPTKGAQMRLVAQVTPTPAPVDAKKVGAGDVGKLKPVEKVAVSKPAEQPKATPVAAPVVERAVAVLVPPVASPASLVGGGEGSLGKEPEVRRALPVGPSASGEASSGVPVRESSPLSSELAGSLLEAAQRSGGNGSPSKFESFYPPVVADVW
jgi:hypothetical protein